MTLVIVGVACWLFSLALGMVLGAAAKCGDRLAAESTRRARPGIAPSPPTPAASFSFRYDECSIGEGVSLAEWRASRRAGERARQGWVA